jgi:hypothetical protein
VAINGGYRKANGIIRHCASCGGGHEC